MRVIVMGGNYISLLGMARAVGMAGHEVTMLRVSRAPSKLVYNRLLMEPSIEKYSRYVKNYQWIKPEEDSLLRAILTLGQEEEKAVLIPTDDFTAAVVDRHQRELETQFLYPHVHHTPGAVIELMDKWRQKLLARQCGMHTADGWPAEKREGRYRIPEGVRYPCIVKPQVSYAGEKSFIRKCETQSALEHALAEIAQRSDCALLIEEFVTIEREYAVVGFCDETSVFVPFLFEMLEDGSGTHKGVTLRGRVLPLPQDGELARQLGRCLHEAGFTGLFDVDLYERNGAVYFNELNVRFGASGYAATALGVNLPRLFLLSLTGDEGLDAQLRQDRLLAQQISEERSFVSEKVALEEYAGGHITRAKFNALLNDADLYFLKPTPGLTEQDAGPYRAFRKNARLSAGKRLIKGLTGK